jgi:uncharacterized protein (TIGR02599 family)
MRTFFPRRRRSKGVGRAGRSGVTLIELLVSLIILLLVLATMLEFLSNVEQLWKTSAVDPFAEAQEAFETIVDQVSAATLAPYQDYADSTGAFRTATTGSFVPDHLARRSDLAFACGLDWLAGTGVITAGDSLFFIAPHGYTQTEAHLGLERLLNALGFFGAFGDESSLPGFILPGNHRWRWRLMELAQPSESLTIYTTSASLPWVQSAALGPTSILAENVVALIVLPERAASDAGPALSTDYHYDSRDAQNAVTRNQLPPRLRLALVAIDEASAQILAAKKGAQPPDLISSKLFTASAQMSADLATLDASLTAQKVGHRIFQREILLPGAAWSNPPAP